MTERRLILVFEASPSCARIFSVIDLAIVIVSYNVSDLLRKCLDSVYTSEGGVRFQVCVVDNNSSDGSVEMVQDCFPQAALISNKENVGYPAGNNLGLRYFHMDTRETGEQPRYCLLLNPDTEVPANAFNILLSYMDDNRDVGVVGPRLVMPDGNLDLACRRAFPSPEVSAYRMLGLSRLFPSSPRFGRYNMTYLPEDQLAEVDSVVGAFMLVRDEAIFQIGLMDERFWMYGEDLDWAKRMKDAGWRVIYHPGVTVLHVKRASSRFSKRAQTEFYRAMLIFYYKHYRWETSWLLHWLVLLGIAIKGGRPIIGDILAGEGVLEDE